MSKENPLSLPEHIVSGPVPDRLMNRLDATHPGHTPLPPCYHPDDGHRVAKGDYDSWQREQKLAIKDSYLGKKVSSTQPSVRLYPNELLN